MKISSAAATAIAAVVLLCALSTGGQQQENRQAPSSSREPRPSRKGKATAKPQQWRMPDGRIMEFPASTSKEEIDALAKRIAVIAVELPPGAKVIGWEPVEGAVSLLPEYDRRVATIPTVKGKLDALANAAGILQAQINSLQGRLSAERAGNTAGFKATDKTLNNHADGLNALAGEVAYLAQQEQMRKRELDDFKEAACPVLRAAPVDSLKKVNLISACGGWY